MALKVVLDSLDDLNEAFHELYEKQGDKYVLTGVDDKDFKSQLSAIEKEKLEMQESLKTMQEKAEKLKDIDPVKYQQMLQEMDKIKQKELVDKGDVNEAVASVKEELTRKHKLELASFTEKLQEAEKRQNEYKGKLDKLVVSTEITKAVNAIGNLRPGAIDDVLLRADRVWHREKDKLVAKGPDGFELKDDNGKNYTPETYAQMLAKQNSYLFQPNTGGGSGGSNKAPEGNQGSVNASDLDLTVTNLEDIASGKVKVDLSK